MKLGILGTGMIVREFLPWLAGPDCPFTVQALCSTQRSAPVADEMCEQYGIPQHTTNYFEAAEGRSSGTAVPAPSAAAPGRRSADGGRAA